MRSAPMRPCGSSVGAQTTSDPPVRAWARSRQAASAAAISFLPDWRGIMTVSTGPRPGLHAASRPRSTRVW